MTDRDHLEAVREFEKLLDGALENRPAFRGGGSAAFRLAANVIEYAATGSPLLASRLEEGLQILAPALVERTGDEEPDVAALLADLDFAAHYHVLRDYLYYTYNAPGSMSWEFNGDVRISFADASLPRQFYIAANSWFVDSMNAFRDSTRGAQIEELLTGTPEFEATDAGNEALALIELEAAEKLDLYFNFTATVDVDLGEYSAKQLFEVYRLLLVKALYHRYHAHVNASYGAIFMNLDALVRDLVDSSTELSDSAARSAVLAMSFGPRARDAGLEALYFSLYHLPDSDEIVMLPHRFALWEGYVNLLRLIGLRDPALFSRVLAGPLGAALTLHLASVFESAGFRCLVDVKLTDFGAHLPDVDLLVISEEPTLGYVVFICEVKSPIPPRWAKDQLRVLAPDSVAKAFVQLDALDEFFRSDTGIHFLRGLLPSGGLPNFDEFALALNALIVTSDNAGAFFTDRGRRIIDFRTLTRLVRRSDGDTAYILHALNEFTAWADAGLQIVPVSVSLGETEVTYDGVTIKSLMDFAQVEFRSAGVPDKLVQAMLEAGDRPLDVLRRVHEPNAKGACRAIRGCPRATTEGPPDS
jgi:hypothetical protein